jgi:hypothetical protein
MIVAFHVAMYAANDVSVAVDQTVAIVAAAILIGLGTWSIKRQHEIRQENKTVRADVTAIKTALLGTQASEFNSESMPGLIMVVNSLVPEVAAHGAMLKELVMDKKPNSGRTTRDAIDRIEESLGTSPTVNKQSGGR